MIRIAKVLSVVGVGLVGVGLCFFTPGASAYDEVTRGRTTFIYKDCRTCHGDKGLGSQNYQAPNLAGREAWYMEKQLRKFRAGTRGAHAEDEAGKIMAPVSKGLTEMSLRGVAMYLESLDGSRIQHTLRRGDVQAGKVLYQTCIPCHGSRGQGDRKLQAPQLTKLNDWYIVAQLDNFKRGIRGRHPDDTDGAQMLDPVETLQDRRAMEDVAAYIRSLR